MTNCQTTDCALLDRTGAPKFAWLLAMCYVCFVLNHTYNATIKQIHLNAAAVSTCDVSPLLRFHFWEPVLFITDDSVFPSDSPEERGRLVGISENVGHNVNFKILNSSTNKTVDRYNVRSATDNETPNFRDDPVNSPEVITSLSKSNSRDNNSTSKTSQNEVCPTSETPIKESSSTSSSPKHMPVIDPDNLVGRTFFLNK